MQWVEGDVQSGGDANAVSVHYYRAGTKGKPPLVLSHGFTDNGLCWQRFIEAIESDYDVVMLDSRNHGLSGAGPASHDLLAQDVATVVSHLDVGPVAILGHSMGGNVAARFAADYPALVARLLLEDPAWVAQPADPSKIPVRQRAFREYVASLAEQSDEELLAAGRTQHPRWNDVEFPHWIAANRQVRPGAIDHAELGDWRALVPRIQCPGVLIYAAGERDGMVSHEVAAEVNALNPNIKLQHIADGGHNLRREQFEAFVVAVTEFLAS